MDPSAVLCTGRSCIRAALTRPATLQRRAIKGGRIHHSMPYAAETSCHLYGRCALTAPVARIGGALGDEVQLPAGVVRRRVPVTERAAVPGRARPGRWRQTADDAVSDPGYMSRKIRKFRTDKFDTFNKRKF